MIPKQIENKGAGFLLYGEAGLSVFIEKLPDIMNFFGQIQRMQEVYELDKNKRSTRVDTIDANTEKLNRIFVEKYRQAG